MINSSLNKLFDNFWSLNYTQREKILIEVIGWSSQKVRELYEDFGYNMSGVIIRHLKDKALLKDFELEVNRSIFGA